jgi:hypothetical protein
VSYCSCRLSQRLFFHAHLRLRVILIHGARHTVAVGAARLIAGSRLCNNVWPQSAALAAPASQTNFIILEVPDSGPKLGRLRITAMEAATAVIRFHLTTSMIDQNVPSLRAYRLARPDF